LTTFSEREEILSSTGKYLVIREATKDDLLMLADLEAQIFPENCFNEKTIGDTLARGGGFVADNLSLPMGYAIYNTTGSMTDILRIGVLPSVRRLGFGEALLKKCMSISEITMLTVRQNNQPAISLYAKHGFNIAGWVPSHGSWVMRTSS
jgi:ribosomal protein S18 acetylase RimI-like enzyme